LAYLALSAVLYAASSPGSWETTDIREMNSGRMDPAGRGLTQAGKICGMVSVVLAIAGFLLGFLMMLLRTYPNNRVVMRPSEKSEAKAAGQKARRRGSATLRTFLADNAGIGLCSRPQ
jgi:hypothetical protein